MMCVSGFSGSGKDEFAGVLERELDAPKVGLADPAKRHLADLYGFTEHQLFGPSAARNAGDLRYPKPEASGLVISQYSAENPPPGIHGALTSGAPYWELNKRNVDRRLPPDHTTGMPYIPGKLGNATVMVKEGDPKFWLSPREALQRYCELMNLMYGDTWVRKFLSTHLSLGETTHQYGDHHMIYSYDRMRGLIRNDDLSEVLAPKVGSAFFTCSSDFRHKHEFRAARRLSAPDFVPVTVRIRRPSVPSPPYAHRSETEQADIPDSFFDFVVNNDGSLEDLYSRAREVCAAVQGPGWAPRRGDP